MKIKDSIKLFLEHCEFEKRLSQDTLIAYQSDLAQLRKFLFQNDIEFISNIDKTVVKSYVQSLSEFKPKTIKRKIASAKAYLNLLEFEDYITVNPFRKVKIRIKEPRQLPCALEFEEIRDLLKVVRRAKDKIKDRSSHYYGEKLRDLTILEILFATGIRVSELCGIKPNDINLTSGNLLVTGKGNKERIIQICNPETLDLIKKYTSFYRTRIDSVGFFLSAG